MAIWNITNQRGRETLRFIRDICVGILAILGAGWTVYAAWEKFEVWGIVIVLFLALIFAICFYYNRKIKSTPYMKEGPEAELEAVNILKNTKESLHYYGGVSFITASTNWNSEYIKKLESEITITRFLDVLHLDEMNSLLQQVMLDEEASEMLEDYRKWINTHCDNLKKRAQHNCFYNFKGAPIWRYGLHCIIFDRKHIVLPFASGEKNSVTRAIFIPNCPQLANALAHCLEWLITDFGLDSLNNIELAEEAGLS